MGVNSIGMSERYLITLKSGEDIDVQTTMRDTLAWEKANKGKPFLGNGMLSHHQMLWVAWSAARREGKTDVKSFDAFAVQVVDLGTFDDDEDDFEDDDQDDEGQVSMPDPGGPAPTAG